MRVKYSIINIATGLIGQGLSLILSFISRIVFVNTLNAEYLGINGLFTNIIYVLSLVELGIGQAIIYSLYKPIAEDNKAKIQALMNLYAKTYRIIGSVVFLLGIIISLFLDLIIKDQPNIPNLQFIFILFLLNTVITYFYAHKRSIIIANQKNYVINIIHYTFYIIVNILQIIVLIQTHNFIFFILVQFFFNLISNLFIAYMSNKMYPFLKKKNNAKLDRKNQKIISKNVYAMMFHRVGDVVVFGTDNILISSFFGVVWVGLYSNYLLITQALNTILGQIFSSITASVGNLNVEEEVEKKLFIFNVTFFVNFWIYGISSICLVNLFNPFIEFWLGNEYTMEMSIVILIVVNFYLSGIRKATLTFKDAFGLFWYDRYKPLAEVLINIFGSIILMKFIGIQGVFLGTIISTITTCLWIEPYVLFKYGLYKSVKPYFAKLSLYTAVLAFSGSLVYFLSIYISDINVIAISYRLIISLIIPNLIFYVIFRKTQEFIQLKKIFTVIIYDKLRNKTIMVKLRNQNK